jgi:outer membrane receptor for ferrienterochelin and colicins
MSTQLRFCFRAVLGLCLFAAAPAAAQTGTITGRITDQVTGAALSSVLVRAETPAGRTVITSQTNADGQYLLLNVPAGRYTVVVSSLGYREARQAEVVLGGGQTLNLPFSLEIAPFSIPEIIVTGGRTPERYLESPASVVGITGERVEERIALQPTEHLVGLQGIDYAQTGLLSSTVVARGFSNVFSTSLLAITDYRYTNVPSLRVNSSFLMPAVGDDIERIEVLLGPGSALYGPNAANGVMHVMTQSPFTHPGTAVSIGGGERSVLTTSGRHAGTVGERFGYKVTGQWMQGREWEFIDQEEVAARGDSIPPRDYDLSRWSGEARVDYQIAADRGVVLSVGRSTATNAIEMTPFGAAQAKGWDLTYYQARFTFDRLFAQAFMNSSNAGNTFLLRTGAPIVDESRLYAAQVQNSTPFGPRQTFTYGIDVQRTDPRTGGTIHGRFEDDDDSNEVGGYLMSESRMTPQLDLLLAGRYDYHSRVVDNVFSPRAAIVFRAIPDHNFRATYNRAFGTPLNSQLFLDLQAGSIGALPFQVRAIGGAPGWNFRRDCNGGICIRSPFAAGQTPPDAAAWRPADATPYWATATSILFQSTQNRPGGPVDIRMIPAPSATQVHSVLRRLNPHPQGAFFETVQADELTDISPLAPSISNTFELGYKGVLGGRLLLAVDLWHQRRNNFVSAALVETPNLFYDLATLTQYLSNFMPAANAGQIAAAMAGLDNNPAVTGIPLGTAGFDSPHTTDQHVYLSYRNYGDVKLWGSDIGLEAILSSQVAVTGTYSWLSDNTLRTIGAGGGDVDVLLNAPANKGSVGLRLNRRDEGLGFNALVRFVDAFPMNSGVYVGTVDGYTILDAGVTWRVPQVRGVMLTLQAQNLLNDEQQQFIGAPRIGRLVTGRVSYRF